MSDVLPPSGTRKRIETNGVTLHTIVAGPVDGPPVVLLHGFPEFWYGWRHQISPLVEAGYRVIAPDQRGYNRSEKPPGVDAYGVDELAADVSGLLDALGHDRARFVGHDWGGAVVWQLLAHHPQRVERAVVMNVPHPGAFMSFFPWKLAQVRMSWYIPFFQLPRLPERWLRRKDWHGFRQFLETANRESAFTDADLDRYRSAWRRPGAPTGMVNWYRALVRGYLRAPDIRLAELPTLLIWGTGDPYLHSGMARQSVDQCTNGRLVRIDDATHWLHHEVPETVNGYVLDFLAK